ncbi:hypothetical protein, partial [Rhodoferax antarcticus]
VWLRWHWGTGGASGSGGTGARVVRLAQVALGQAGPGASCWSTRKIGTRPCQPQCYQRLWGAEV